MSCAPSAGLSFSRPEITEPLRVPRFGRTFTCVHNSGNKDRSSTNLSEPTGERRPNQVVQQATRSTEPSPDRCSDFRVAKNFARIVDTYQSVTFVNIVETANDDISNVQLCLQHQLSAESTGVAQGAKTGSLTCECMCIYDGWALSLERY